MANCPTRKHCFGCASNMHPYEKCEFKLVKCERCKLVGHTERVHHAQDMQLSEELFKAHPQEFTHFLHAEPERRSENPASRVGLQKPPAEVTEVVGAGKDGAEEEDEDGGTRDGSRATLQC